MSKVILPGQLWVDRNGVWNPGYNGEMLYVVGSREPDEPWVLHCFQEWSYGAHERKFDSDEIRKMEYVGHIRDLKGT